MPRPKKDENERWISWGDYRPGGRTGRSGTKNTGHYTRNYGTGYSASIYCKKEDGEIIGELCVELRLPVYTVPHGRSLSDRIHTLIERHREELIRESVPDAVRRRLGWVSKETLGVRVEPMVASTSKRA